MVNLRAHDPFSGHAPADTVGEGGNDPIQPITPGEHPPPPVTQPPVDDPDRATPPPDGLEDELKADLVDLAAAMRLPTSGTKADLIDRIRADRANSPQ